MHRYLLKSDEVDGMFHNCILNLAILIKENIPWCLTLVTSHDERVMINLNESNSLNIYVYNLTFLYLLHESNLGCLEKRLYEISLSLNIRDFYAENLWYFANIFDQVYRYIEIADWVFRLTFVKNLKVFRLGIFED